MSPKQHIDLMKHPFVLAAIAIVVLIAGGSVAYYIHSTTIPNVTLSASDGVASNMLTATGVVSPATNPNLAFAAGGRVTTVNVAVGSRVSAGQVLASLDTAGLSAQRAQAQAGVASAQAHLADLLRGARPEDVAVKQAVVDQASASQANAYTNAATAATQAYDKAFGGFSVNTDSLFNNANTSNPSLVFNTVNNQLALAATIARVSAQGELVTWQHDAASYTTTNADAALTSALSHLNVLRTYSDALIAALGSAVPSSSFPQSSVSAAQASVSTYRDAINSLITSLQSSQQGLVSARLALQSAQATLNQTTAAATPETITAARAAVDAAQANVTSIDAQIRNDLIVAPFSGTVASVGVKTGDIVAANTRAVSLNPDSALQVATYFSEIDIAKIHVGDTANVTLDAYGKDRIFPATVAAVDAAPSTAPSGSSGYKVTLQFAHSDPSVSSGMSANITIPLTR